MNKNWFTRKHQGEDIDPVYLSNMIKATEYFIGWFKGYFNTSYERMLKRMHHMACANGYGGSQGSSPERVSDKWRQDWQSDWLLKKEWYANTGYGLTISPSVRYLPMRSHWLHTKEKGYELHLSGAKFVLRNVEILGMLMGKLETKFDPVLLADYMHVFVVTHPFEKVNFSICMAQVNAILDMNGYETLYHEYMDFACFLYDSDIIEKMFVSRLCKKVTL